MRTLWGSGMKLLISSLLVIVSSCSVAYADAPEVVLQTIAMESANQSAEGQAWVAKTIQTRAQRAKRSPESVVKRPKQYSCWNSPKWASAWLRVNYTTEVRQRASQAYRMALSLPAVTHYHTKAVKPYWAKHKSMKPVKVIGDHMFYEEYNQSEVMA